MWLLHQWVAFSLLLSPLACRSYTGDVARGQRSVRKLMAHWREGLPRDPVTTAVSTACSTQRLSQRPHSYTQLSCVDRQCKDEMLFPSFWVLKYIFIYLKMSNKRIIENVLMIAKSANQPSWWASLLAMRTSWRHEKAIFYCFWHEIANSLLHAVQ